MKNNTLILAGGITAVVIVGFFLIQGMNQRSQNPADIQPDMQIQDIDIDTDQSAMDQNLQTVVEIAASNDDFSTLVTAVSKAGLVETLSGPGPFTVFAPTNAAFDKLPEGTIESLLNDKDALTDVLTYHVVPGKIMAADVVTMSNATTVQGQDLAITVDGNIVQINNASVVQPDIEASNGVIHVIDTVLLPQ